jgi:hypothetical protein
LRYVLLLDAEAVILAAPDEKQITGPAGKAAL